MFNVDQFWRDDGQESATWALEYQPQPPPFLVVPENFETDEQWLMSNMAAICKLTRALRDVMKYDTKETAAIKVVEWDDVREWIRRNDRETA